jgi:hypothetical protein
MIARAPMKVAPTLLAVLAAAVAAFWWIVP